MEKAIQPKLDIPDEQNPEGDKFVQEQVIPMIMSDRAYTIMKWFIQYIIPGVAFLYSVISGIWNLPYGDQIIGTIIGIDFVLGVITGISSNQYYKLQELKAK